MVHGSLFSGIGGFDLAAEWMGWENKFHCEWNEFCQKVLHHYCPNAQQFTDITKTDFTPYANRIDILTGGFPCQPYSVAGKRKGKEDERHLWPEMLRAIREISPRWVVGENVFGLINWNGGLVFDEVQTDLEAEGYEVWPYVLPACAVNAPHRRDRVWFVAFKNTNRDGCGGEFREEEPSKRGLWNTCAGNNEQLQANNGKVGTFTHTESIKNIWRRQGGFFTQPSGFDVERDAPSTHSPELQRCDLNGGIGEKGSFKTSSGQLSRPVCTTWENFPTQSPVCTGNDGFPAGLDGITFSKWRNESIKAAGNAIVPQVALQIFKAIQQYENILTSN